MTDLSRITHDPAVRNGKPCIRGLSITVREVLDWLADGMSLEDIRKTHPLLEAADIEAAVFYAKDNMEKVAEVTTPADPLKRRLSGLESLAVLACALAVIAGLVYLELNHPAWWLWPLGIGFLVWLVWLIRKPGVLLGAIAALWIGS